METNLTLFSYRLLEKQKFRFYYGIIEKYITYYIKRRYITVGSMGKILIIKLEIRLDNIVYRLSWMRTILFARQIIRHGHILVNYKRILKPRFHCKSFQKIILRKIDMYKWTNVYIQRKDKIPTHLFFNIQNIIGQVNRIIQLNELSLDIEELLVIEYYSNRK